MPDKESPVRSEEASAGEGGGGAVKMAQPRVAVRTRTESKPLPPYNVVLLDDDDHTYEYVIEMLAKVCAHPVERGYQLAKQVDSQGRAIVLTTHKEKAELKRDQILAFGADFRMERSNSSMKAIIEPVPG